MGKKRRPLLGDGQQFARMTSDLLRHPAVATLRHASFRMLVSLTVGARGPSRHDGGRNGTQAVTGSFAKEHGLGSSDTRNRSIKELIGRGLIEETRKGFRNKAHFALYAVTWLPITHRDGRPLDRPEPATFLYKKVSIPQRQPKKVPNRWALYPGRGKKIVILQSESRIQPCPNNGQDSDNCRPKRARKDAKSRPANGRTLRGLGLPSPGSDDEKMLDRLVGGRLDDGVVLHREQKQSCLDKDNDSPREMPRQKRRLAQTD